MAKVHGSLARAGKVKNQTPKVQKDTEKKKKPRGRAYMRMLYLRRFINVTLVNGKLRMNPAPEKK
ncbi:ribosomal protein S30 [Ramicandelaber brevisporus]|nr:ribosomal protein S30 [Ramicandelaber brevisporus]